MFHALFHGAHIHADTFPASFEGFKDANWASYTEGVADFHFEKQSFAFRTCLFFMSDQSPFLQAVFISACILGDCSEAGVWKGPFPFYFFEESFYNWERTRRSPLLSPQ